MRSWPKRCSSRCGRATRPTRGVAQLTPYVAESGHFARRSLQNIALSYLMLTGKPQVLAAALEQYEACDNMTERLHRAGRAGQLTVRGGEGRGAQGLCRALQGQRPGHGPVVQRAGRLHLPGGLARVQALMQHPAFTLKNPNKVRALIGAFAGQNLVNFHAADGSGYRFLADQVISLNATNPQIASRQLGPLTRWRKYDASRQAADAR